MGMAKPWFGKSKKFYAKQKAKALKQKAKCEMIINICDEELNKDGTPKK